MTILAFVLLSQNALMHGEETLLVQASSLVAQAFEDSDETKQARRQFTFVDVGYELSLIPKTDAYGFPIGTQPIVDRASLAQFFERLRQADAHRFVICDVLFEDEAPADSLLRPQITGLDRVVVPYRVDDGTPADLQFDVPSALAQYPQTWGLFLKYPLVQYDSLATLPLHVHQQLYPDVPVTGPLALNTFIVDFRLLPGDVGTPIPLGNLQSLADSTLIDNYVRDRIVVLGDFSRGTDVHETVYGSMAGSLILANTVLALSNQDNVLRPGLLALLLLAFTLATAYTLYAEIGVRWRDGAPRSGGGDSGPFAVREVLADGVEVTLSLVGISMVSYFVFGLHLPVLLLAVWLTAFTEAVRYRHVVRRRLRTLWAGR